MEWEQCKENVQPLKKGRSTRGLGQMDKMKTEEKRNEFLEKLEAARKTSIHDLLTIYVEFYSWLRRTLNDTEKAKLLLENCTKELGQKEELSNDPKLVKIWLEYADLVQDPIEIFQFMSTNNIGSKLSLFWIAWAFYLEKSGNFKGADKVFLTGIRQLAQPKDLLNRRYHQFQRRMTRQFLSDDGDLDDLNESERRFAQSSTGTGIVSFKQAQKAEVSKSIPVPNSLGFTIFSDDIGDDANMSESNSVQGIGGSSLNKIWNNLGTEQERKKENEMLKSKWSENPLPIPKITTTVNANNSNSFQIFVEKDVNDEVASNQNDNSNPVLISAISKTNHPVKSNLGSVALKPEVDENNIVKSSLSAKAPLPSKSAKAKVNPFLADKDNDETINTKLALADLEDMFACSEFDDQARKENGRGISAGMPFIPNRRKIFLNIPSTFVDHIFEEIDESRSITEKTQETSELRTPIPVPMAEAFEISFKRNVCLSESPRQRGESNLYQKERKHHPVDLLVLNSGNFDDVVKDIFSRNMLVNAMESYYRVFYYPTNVFHGLNTAKKHIRLYQSYSFFVEGQQPIRSLNIEGRKEEFFISGRVGKGNFGQALLISKQEENGETHNFVIKIDKCKYSVNWECYIHTVMHHRLLAFNTLNSIYLNCFLPPLHLHIFKDCAMMQMGYADIGTLLDVFSALRKELSAAEHELIVAYFALQMLLAQSLLIRVGIIHGDVKTDNWVLGCWKHDIVPFSDINEELQSIINLHLIDFGKSRVHLMDEVSYQKWQKDERRNGIQTGSAVTSVAAFVSLVRCLERREVSLSWSARHVFYSQGKFAKGFERSPTSMQPWSYENDFYGIAACVYQLLHFEELRVQEEPIFRVSRRFKSLDILLVKNPSISPDTKVTFPLLSVKRYWNTEMWNEIFLTLLNPSLIQPLNQVTPIYEESFLQSAIEAVRAFLQTRSNQAKQALLKFKHIILNKKPV